MDWQPIDTAPKDGTPVTTINNTSIKWFALMFPITSRWIDGKWQANFGTIERQEWKPYSPQPTFWKPVR